MKGIVLEAIREQMPRKGNVERLGVSRHYLDALFDGTVQRISQPLLERIVQHYNMTLPTDDVLTPFEKEPITRNGIEYVNTLPLLVNFEHMTFLSPEVDKELHREERLSIERMVELLQQHYHKAHVLTKSSRALTTLAQYFAISQPLQHGLDTFEDEFYLTDPYGDSIPRDKAVIRSQQEDMIKYSVDEQFLPGGITEIYTTSQDWKTKYYVNQTTGFNRQLSPDDHHGTIFVTFHKPLSAKVKSTIENYVATKYRLTLTSKGNSHAWFEENQWYANHTKDGLLRIRAKQRPSLVQADEEGRTWGFRCYPYSILTDSHRGTVNQLRPSIEQQYLINILASRTNLFK